MESYPREDIFTPKFVRVYDPILDNQPKKVFPILKGGVETTERVYSSTSFSSTSVSFNVIPPNQTTFVSRRFLLKCQLTIFLAGTNLGTNIQGTFQPGRNSLRQFPLHSVMKTIDLSINGQSTTLNMNDFIKPLLLYHNNQRDLNEREMSLSPGLRDKNQVMGALFQTQINPMAKFGNGDVCGCNPRGAFPLSISNANKQSTLVVELVEELLISPLLFGGVEDQGFIGIQKIDINITWDSGKLQRVFTSESSWSANTDASVTIDEANTVVTFSKAPELLFRYVTPPIDMPIPRYIQYSYNQIQRYPKDLEKTADYSGGNSYPAPGSVTSKLAVSDNIQLNAIPRFLYIYIRRNNSERGMFNTDSYFEITQLQVNWNNSNALLANASQQQLYDISRKNGCDLPWLEWSAQPSHNIDSNGAAPNNTIKYWCGLGSVMCLEFGTDIGLREDEAPGLIGTYNLQVTVNYKNRNATAAPFTPTLYLVTVIPGIFTIYDNSASKRIGVFSRDDVLRSRPDSQLDYYDLQKNLMSGGLSFKKFKRWYKKKGSKLANMAGNIAKGLLPVGKHSYVDKALKAANIATGSGMIGGRKRRKGKKPGPKKR